MKKYEYMSKGSHSLLDDSFLNKHFGGKGWEIVSLTVINENLDINIIYLYTLKRELI